MSSLTSSVAQLFGGLVDVLGEGRLVVAGAIAGPTIELDLRRLYLHSRRIVGSAMWTPAHFAKLAKDANAGAFTPVLAARYPLEEIAKAQSEFDRKQFVGKFVLTIPRFGDR